MKQRKRKRDGYWVVNLSKSGIKYTKKIYRLVALHHIDNPENKPEVDHLFGKDKNDANSLRWATKSENMQRSFDVGTHISPACKGQSNGRAKLTVVQVADIRNNYSKSSTRKLAAEYGVSNTLISKIVNNKLWNHGLS